MAKSVERKLEELYAKKRADEELIRQLEKEKRENDKEKMRKHIERTKIQRARLHSQMGEKMDSVRTHLSGFNINRKGADGETRKISAWEDLCEHVPGLAELLEKYDKLDEKAPMTTTASEIKAKVEKPKAEKQEAPAAKEAPQPEKVAETPAKAEEKSSEKTVEPAKAEEKKPAENTEASASMPSIGGIDLSNFMS